MASCNGLIFPPATFQLYLLAWSDGMTALGGCDMNLKDRDKARSKSSSVSLCERLYGPAPPLPAWETRPISFLVVPILTGFFLFFWRIPSDAVRPALGYRFAGLLNFGSSARRDSSAWLGVPCYSFRGVKALGQRAKSPRKARALLPLTLCCLARACCDGDRLFRASRVADAC